MYDKLMVGSEAFKYFYKGFGVEYIDKGVWYDVTESKLKLFDVDLYIFRLKK